jgi:fatty acid/phospholipid biosynthesis enzyme
LRRLFASLTAEFLKEKTMSKKKKESLKAVLSKKAYDNLAELVNIKRVEKAWQLGDYGKLYDENGDLISSATREQAIASYEAINNGFIRVRLPNGRQVKAFVAPW